MYSVELAIYDLSNGLASQMSQAILGQRIDGIWHTGVIIYSYEYYFGGGIQKQLKGQFTLMNGIRPCQIIKLGDTNITQDIFEEYLQNIKSQYTQETYDLLYHNCNNFSDTICKFLLGTGIPSYIIDLPRVVLSSPGGAMLRPLLEGMQNNIRSQSSNPLDPFGGSNNNIPSAFNNNNNTNNNNNNNVYHEQNLSQAITQTLQNTSTQSSSQNTDINIPLPSFLAEERPLISSERDSKPILAMLNKILTYQDPNTSQLVINQSQQTILQETVQQLTNSTISLQSLSFPNEAFIILSELGNNYSSLELACLFIMRLIILIPNDINFTQIHPILNKIIQRISITTSQKSISTNSTLRPFSSNSQLVLAFCLIANCISYHNGCYLIFTSPSKIIESESEIKLLNGEELLSLCIDLAMWGMCNERADIRQICGALAYNISLASTKWEQDITPGIELTWRNLHIDSTFNKNNNENENNENDLNKESDEVHPHLIQLFCGSIDNLDNETDPTSLRRRMLTAYRVSRSGGENMKNLALELEFNSIICEIKKKETILSNSEDKNFVVHLENYFKA